MKNAYLILLFVLIPAFASAQADKGEVRSGNRKFRKDSFREAEIDYRKALLKDSLSVAANYNLASTLYRESNYEEASKSLDNIKKLADSPDYHFNCGDVALQKKDYAAAVKAFRESLLRNPGDLDAKENYIYAKKMLENQQNQQNQNQDQNQDQQNQDQNQDQNQQDQNQDQQNQDQNQDKNQQSGDQKISPQQAQQMLSAVQAQEKKTKDKVDKEKAALLKSREKDKNW